MTEQIKLNSGDSCFERARKMLAVASIVDDGLLAGRISETIQIYMDLDLKAVEHEQFQMDVSSSLRELE